MKVLIVLLSLGMLMSACGLPEDDVLLGRFEVERTFEKGQKVSDEQRAALNLQRRHTCPNWNYTIYPRKTGSNY